MKTFCISLLSLAIISCGKISREKLNDYLDSKPVSEEWLIACAAGDKDGFDESGKFATSVFFYPVSGTVNKRYFETQNLDQDPLDYSNYKEVKNIEFEDVFNGYLNHHLVKSDKEKWGIMTYEVDDSIRVSDPIKILPRTRQTEQDESLVMITENGVEPSFTWKDGQHKENVIYFQVISDESGDLISGTYTLSTNWKFYDLSNVVINIKPEPTPVLEKNKTYDFMLMSVSDDNWVNVAVTKSFRTAE